MKLGCTLFKRIEMDTDKPHTHYQEHKRKYPPANSKKKVRIKINGVIDKPHRNSVKLKTKWNNLIK
jgi:hypothetical protein